MAAASDAAGAATGAAPAAPAPHGAYPPADRFGKEFDPDKRETYTAEYFARDAK